MTFQGNKNRLLVVQRDDTILKSQHYVNAKISCLLIFP